MEQALTLELMLSFFATNDKDENIKALKDDLAIVKASYDKLNTEMSPKNYKEFCAVIRKLRNSYTS
jgi:hypothetical protein